MNKAKEKFYNEIKQTVQNFLGYQYLVSVQTVEKTNVTLTGLCIRERTCNIAPTIYLEEYYEAHNAGLSVERIAEEIIRVYRQNRPSGDFNIDTFSNFASLKERIAYKIINRKMNESLLEKVPYVPFLDLAIVFYVVLEKKQDCNATVLIHNNHMEMWKTNTKELFDLATVNTRKIFAPEVKTMDEVMREILKEQTFGEALEEVTGRELDEIFGLTEPAEKCPMYVLSNVQKLNGACAILYDDVLKNIAKMVGSDLWILPSSIHETLLIPHEVGQSFEELKKMVQEVNETTLEACDILSDHPYFYSLKENRISIRTEILIAA